MTRMFTSFVLVSLLAAAVEASAQDAIQRQPPVEITLIPAGATDFVKADETGLYALIAIALAIANPHLRRAHW